MCKIPPGGTNETRGIWGRKRKERSTTGSLRGTHTDNKGEDDQECLFDFGKERSTARNGGQQLHLHKNPTKDNRRNKRKDQGTQAHRWVKRERMKKKRARDQERSWGQGLGSRAGSRVGRNCWSCASDRDSCHVSGRGNQSAPRRMARQTSQDCKLARLLSKSFLIKFSSLPAPAEIERLTAGSDEKTQRNPARDRTQGLAGRTL